MAIQQFFLCGDGVSTAVALDISAVQNVDELRRSISAHYGIAQPESVAFQAGDSGLSELHEITDSKTPIGITVDGHSVRDVPGPQGLPWVGNYFEGMKHLWIGKVRLTQSFQCTLTILAIINVSLTSTGLSSAQRTWARPSARPTILSSVRSLSQRASSSQKRLTMITLSSLSSRKQQAYSFPIHQIRMFATSSHGRNRAYAN
jgi:hypothetical protein